MSEKPVYAVGASVLVTNEAGQLLLARRRNNSGAGLLSTPGGRVEYDESVEEAAVREFKEECLTDCGPVRIIGWRKHNRFGNHYFMFYLHALLWKSAPVKNGIPDKSEDWTWYNVGALTPENCTEPMDILQLLYDEGHIAAPPALER